MRPDRECDPGQYIANLRDGALPLASGSRVNLFGYGSVDPIYGGTGSGSGDTSANVDVVKGLQNAGLEVNEELVKFYRNAGVSRPKQGGYTGSNFTPTEVPASAYTDAVLQQAKDFSNYETVDPPYWTYAFRGSFDGAGHTIRNLTIEIDGCKSAFDSYDASIAVWRNDGEALGSEAAFFGATAGGEKLLYIANGDVTDEAAGETYAGNIDAVIAEYGSAVPASFLQKAAIVLVDG